MRYVVTGAAGFIGSHLAEALARRRPRGRRDRLLHRLLRPGAEGGERARARRAAGSTSPRTSSTSPASTRVFHLAGQPGVRSFGDVFPLYLRRNVLASQRVFEAAARDGVRVVFASSSSVYGASRALPDPRGDPTAAALPLRDHEARLRAARRRLRARVRARLRRPALLQRLRAQAAARHGLHADRQRPRDGTTFALFGDGDQSRGWTYVGDVVEATVAAAERGSGIYNVGGAIEASLNEAIGLLEQISGRTLELEREPAVPGDQRRTQADTTPDPRRARLGAARSGSRTVCARSGSGPRLESLLG